MIIYYHILSYIYMIIYDNILSYIIIYYQCLWFQFVGNLPHFGDVQLPTIPKLSCNQHRDTTVEIWGCISRKIGLLRVT